MKSTTPEVVVSPPYFYSLLRLESILCDLLEGDVRRSLEIRSQGDEIRKLRESFSVRVFLALIKFFGILSQLRRDAIAGTLSKGYGHLINTVKNCDPWKLNPVYVRNESQNISSHYCHLWYSIIQEATSNNHIVVLGKDLWPLEMSYRHRRALDVTLKQELISDETLVRSKFSMLRDRVISPTGWIYLPGGLVLHLDLLVAHRSSTSPEDVEKVYSRC